MIERVRAVLVTPDGCLLAIRRDRPGRATYWVLPGGHVDPGDQSLEAALSREISEEIAGEAEITSLVQCWSPGQETNASTSTSADHVMGLHIAYRAGVRRARTQQLPAGADPADCRRARRHRPPADRDRRTAP